MLINGLPADLIHANDRGLSYGDGVFRTMLVQGGCVLHWPRHYSKLQHDCGALKFECPSVQVLTAELNQLIQTQPDGIVKITITRGTATRGYAPAANPDVSRIVSINPTPSYPDSYATSGIAVHLCQLRLGHQPLLAGIKHLNRLENVLASAEWNNADNIAEGILLDEEDYLIEATRSNLFLVKDGVLFTPELLKCGVAGVQRDRVMDWARKTGVMCNVGSLRLWDLHEADEVFLVNSVIGLWPVREMNDFRRDHFPISLLIQDWLNHGSD